jgi:hypothetical protein
MSNAEQTCLQAIPLFAVAIKACEDGNSDNANALTKLASEAFNHEPPAARAASWSCLELRRRNRRHHHAVNHLWYVFSLTQTRGAVRSSRVARRPLALDMPNNQHPLPPVPC